MIQKNVMFVAYALSISSASILFTDEASAKGCNGVVNQLEWGCAAWDNNNGPKFPHYKKPASAPPAAKVAPAPLAVPKAQAIPQASVLGKGSGVIAQGGGNLISPGNKTGVIAQGGGNLISPGNKTGVIAQGGGNLISPGNKTGVIAQGGGN
jgi:hypothetical protein